MAAADDFFMSLNGFDEIAIAKEFKADLNKLREQPFMFLRALVFVDKRRAGLKDSEAYKAAMEATVGQLNGYFDEPDKPGKG